jgi:hypothetical protein
MAHMFQLRGGTRIALGESEFFSPAVIGSLFARPAPSSRHQLVAVLIMLVIVAVIPFLPH